MKKEEFASLLGLAGLVPFIGLALVTTSPDAARVQLAVKALSVYAALILTFLGGLHWGAMLSAPNYRLERARLRYLWSVVPSLVAWPLLVLLTPVQSLPWLALALAIIWAIDVYLYRAQGNLNWFIKLRTTLTVVACGGLLFAWWTVRNTQS
jgi:hypothetical protein